VIHPTWFAMDFALSKPETAQQSADVVGQPERQNAGSKSD